MKLMGRLWMQSHNWLLLVNKGTASASEVLFLSFIHACRPHQGHAAMQTKLYSCLSSEETTILQSQAKTHGWTAFDLPD